MIRAAAPNRFANEDPEGPVDTWFSDIAIPPRPTGPPRVAIVAIWFGALPKWMDYFTQSAALSQGKGWLKGDGT